MCAVTVTLTAMVTTIAGRIRPGCQIKLLNVFVLISKDFFMMNGAVIVAVNYSRRLEAHEHTLQHGQQKHEARSEFCAVRCNWHGFDQRLFHWRAIDYHTCHLF